MGPTATEHNILYSGVLQVLNKAVQDSGVRTYRSSKEYTHCCHTCDRTAPIARPTGTQTLTTAPSE